ncbi:MAG: TolC family protein [Candidatus Saganbacteria bacterium]|nr:TolC family protein [Candidatus Saganbacteria bacterium]
MKRGVIFSLISVFLLFSSPSFSLNLKESIDIALKNNDNVVIVQRKADAASARVSESFSSYLPSVTLSANYARNYQAPIKTMILNTPLVMGIDDVSALKGWQASFQQSIFTFGKNENTLAIAMENAKSAREDLRKALQDCIYNVAQAYFNYLKAKKSVQLSNESLEMATAHLDQTKKMLKVGMATRADTLRSEVSVSRAKQSLIKANNGLEVGKAAFNTSIGRAIGEEIDVEDVDLSSGYEGKEYSYKQMLTDAFTNRPDWKQVKGSVEISARNRGLAVSQWMPSVNLQGYYQWSNNDYDVADLNYDARNWQVAGAATWTIFNGFSTQSKIKEAQANLDSSIAGREMTRKAVEFDVKQAYLNWEAAKEMLESATAGIDSARENFNIAEIRYKNGLATNIEVLDAQTSLTQAEIDLMSAGFDLELARLGIERATGLLDKNTALITRELLILNGQMKYVDLEGGFYSFLSDDGRSYVLTGKPAEDIISGAKTGKKDIKISGTLKKDMVTYMMAGQVLEVNSYEWK